MLCPGNMSSVAVLLCANLSDVCRNALPCLLPLTFSVASKSKNLVFEITGDGNLPRVTIVHPVLRNKKGQPFLLFRRILLGRSDKLPLILKNSGNIPAQVT